MSSTRETSSPLLFKALRGVSLPPPPYPQAGTKAGHLPSDPRGEGRAQWPAGARGQFASEAFGEETAIATCKRAVTAFKVKPKSKRTALPTPHEGTQRREWEMGGLVALGLVPEGLLASAQLPLSSECARGLDSADALGRAALSC